MMKKLCLLVLVAALSVSLAACTNNSGSSSGVDAPAASQSAEEPVSETPASEDIPAQEEQGETTGTADESPLQAILGVSAEEAKAVEEILASLDIEWETITVQPFELTDDEELNELESMYREEVTPYDLVDKNGKLYMMSINNSDHTVSSVADSELKQQIYSGES